MLLRTAPIFKIKLLLADIPFGIAASSFHILKVWARSLYKWQTSSDDELQAEIIRCPRERFIRSAFVPIVFGHSITPVTYSA